MNEQTRTKNSFRNIGFSFSLQLCTLIVSFISRTVFIKILGQEYLGINGLYSNILSVLSLADLGIHTAMVYSLYEPIATKNLERISQLVAYFKKLYRIIALAIFCLGLILLPFLQFIIKDSGLTIRNLRLYFLLYLINSVSSYLIVYKTTLIQADQRMFVINIANFLPTVCVHILQIVILYLTRNFALYLCVQILITLTKNLSLNIISNKYYPFLKNKSNLTIETEIKRHINDNLKAVFLYRISATILNSTDNILISILLGTTVVGVYSNYLLITSSLNAFILAFSSALLAGIGNFLATESSQRKLQLFKVLSLLYFLIATFCSCCFVSMFNDFMWLWVGNINNTYILSDISIYAITFTFFINCIINPLWMFRESAGTYVQTKYVMFIAALLNIVLSIIFSWFMGLAGIIFATAIASLMTFVWYEPKVLFKNVFQQSMKGYWVFTFKQGLLASICLFCMVIIGKVLPTTFLFIVLKIFLSGLITGLIFLIFKKINPVIKG